MPTSSTRTSGRVRCGLGRGPGPRPLVGRICCRLAVFAAASRRPGHPAVRRAAMPVVCRPSWHQLCRGGGHTGTGCGRRRRDVQRCGRRSPLRRRSSCRRTAGDLWRSVIDRSDQRRHDCRRRDHRAQRWRAVLRAAHGTRPVHRPAAAARRAGRTSIPGPDGWHARAATARAGVAVPTGMIVRRPIARWVVTH